ncbi:flagellar hook-length control protein FliK [Vannielia litorea]|uniref:flagellar hook-length control protein FliK n=1 Tax=Vannielia litorea TaxID=1217970 RepID=UPI001C942482|nr:flagellar hook-length control protein FliK [Vannielia litorea]MBY6049942.1 flagellar hook-length control protein FliK [Vannielia litorea]MBY6077356.1 flagellar hook-length control protein FliK [Vannielia litorea]
MQSAPDFQKDQVDQKDRLEMQNAMLSELAIFAVTPGAMAGRGAVPAGQGGKAVDAGPDWAAVLTTLEAEGVGEEAADAVAGIVAAVGDAQEHAGEGGVLAEDVELAAEDTEGRVAAGEVSDIAAVDSEAEVVAGRAEADGPAQARASEAPSSLIERIIGAVEGRKAVETSAPRPPQGTVIGRSEVIRAPGEHWVTPARGDLLTGVGRAEAPAAASASPVAGRSVEMSGPAVDVAKVSPEVARRTAVDPQRVLEAPSGDEVVSVEDRKIVTGAASMLAPVSAAEPAHRAMVPPIISPGGAREARVLPEQAAQSGPVPEALRRSELPPKLEVRRADVARATVAPAAPVAVVEPIPVTVQPVAVDALPLVQDVRASAAPTGMPAAPVPQPAAATAQAVAMQIAEISRPLPDGSIELSLQPEELGRLKLSFSGGEAGLHVVVAAERPETLEMMRRHIDLLAQEMRRLGHEGAQFSFAGGEGSFGQQMQGESQSGERVGWADDMARPAAPTTTPAAQALGLGQAGLDLRL